MNSSSEGILASIIVLLKLSQSASTSSEGCLDRVHFYAMLPHYCQEIFSHVILRLKTLIKNVKFQDFY
jgi:hypothetical protein